MNTYRGMNRMVLAGLALLAGSTLTRAAEIEHGLPAETTAVVSVNLKQLLHAPLVKQHVLSSLRQACQSSEAVRAALEVLGLDPLRDLDRLTLAQVGEGEKAEGVVILRGRFDTARFRRTAKQFVGQHGDRLQIHKEDDLVYYSVVSTGKHGSVVFGLGASSKKGAVVNVNTKGCLLDAFGDHCLTLLDKNTLVAATSTELLKETCKALADKDTVSLNKPLRRLLAEVDGKQTIVFAMRPSALTIDKSEAADSGTKHPEIRTNRSPLSEAFSIDPPPLPEPPPSSEAHEEASKSALRELSGTILVSDDFQARCTLCSASSNGAKEVMKAFDELRLRADGLMTLLAGSNKSCAFLKEIPRSFLAVRKGRIILVEGRLSSETLSKLLSMTVQVKSH
jgi:hypothetical protein